MRRPTQRDGSSGRSRRSLFQVGPALARGGLLAAALVSTASPLCAQGQAQVPSAQSAPLPLSGRTASGGTVVATQTPIPGAGGGVETLNPTVLVQGPFAGSLPSTRRAFTGPLTLRDAIDRALDYNLGAVSLSNIVRQSRSQRTVARSALLPNVTADMTGLIQQINLSSFGLRFTSPIPGFNFPTVVGPFNQVDFRGRVSQSVFDRTAWQNYRASEETQRANELSVQDTRDLVVLAVGGSYLQVAATRARLQSARTQLETANALYQQNVQRRAVGLVAQVDVDRSQVQALVQQQRLIAQQNEFAKQKINLARMVGLPPTDQYNLADEVPFLPAPMVTLEDALRRAHEDRADLKALEAQVRAAERGLSAAKAERLPTVGVSADYGAIGPTPSEARRTFSVAGTVRVPIWQGGRAEGHIDQAETVLAQRLAELEDLTGVVEGDVRKSYLDLQSAASQVEVAQKNREITAETLDLTRQRFEAGVSDNVEVVQAQESVASAELDYINSVFAHNLAKLSLARSVGQLADRVADYLKLPATK